MLIHQDYLVIKTPLHNPFFESFYSLLILSNRQWFCSIVSNETKPSYKIIQIEPLQEFPSPNQMFKISMQTWAVKQKILFHSTIFHIDIEIIICFIEVSLMTSTQNLMHMLAFEVRECYQILSCKLYILLWN